MSYLHGAVVKDTHVVVMAFNCYDAQSGTGTPPAYSNNHWFSGQDSTAWWSIFTDSRWVRTNSSLQDSGASSPTWSNVADQKAGDLARWAWVVPHGWTSVKLKGADICYSGKNTSSDSDDWHFTISKGAHPHDANPAHSEAVVTMSAIHEFSVTGTEDAAGDRLYKSTQAIDVAVNARDFIMLSMCRKGTRATGTSSDGDIQGTMTLRFER